ncbi:MAG: arginase family protein, partial [Ignisphaera sp.]
MSYRVYVLEVGHENAFLGFNVDRAKTPFTVVGVPLDISSSFRGGCKEAPASIRTASKSLELCSILTGLNIEYIGFEDIGNIVLSPGDINTSLKRVEEVVKGLLSDSRIPILIGGEHTITLPSFKALALQSLRPCLLVFDAHADLRDEYLGSKYNHATVIRRILDETKGYVLLVGSRAVSKYEVDTYRRFSDRIHIFKLWHGNMSKDTTRSMIGEIKEKLSTCSDIYVSIDLDVVDPAYAPGVQTP